MKRRSFLQTCIAMGVSPALLAACSRKTPAVDTGYLNPGTYVSGNFGPVGVESTITELEVVGAIPEELTGRFLRNGPNPSADVDVDSHHWFVGDGMVHGVRLDNGKADWYRNRYTLGPNTHVIGHANRTWAIVESGTPPVELSYDLDPVGSDPHWGRYTAHPKYDPATGELHAIAYDWATLRDHVEYVVMDVDAQLVRTEKIPLGGMSMVHDMSITENYIVIYDLPVTVSLIALGTGSTFPFRWDDDYAARVGLMPKDGSASDIIWSDVKPNYAYHPMNAYEDAEGNVVIDICRYDRMFDSDTNGPFGDSLPRLDRWTVNPKLRKVTEEIIDERAQEFPRCHPELNGKEYQYGYTLAAEGTSFPAAYKHDLKTGTHSSFEFGPGRHGAECVFVPSDDAESEDDGYLLTFVYDESRDASELMILDAQDLARPALAQVLLPVRVPYGFHGSWISDEDMNLG